MSSKNWKWAPYNEKPMFVDRIHKKEISRYLEETNARRNIMANKTLFATRSITKYPTTDTVNEAGGRAYSLPNAHALAQYVVTGCFGGAYYASADEQLDKIKALIETVDSVTIAKVAVYAREVANMKDTPAYLLAVLAARKENVLLAKAFKRIVTNAKMLCNFVQIVRSGVTGRRSFGSFVRRLIQNWLLSRTGEQLFNDNVGHSNPSLADIIKMVHPKAQTKVANAMFGYILGKDYDYGNLPKNVKDFEKFKKDNSNELPDVPFRVLTNCNLTEKHWKKIARDMPWNTLRMNLNMLQRNGVFNDNKMIFELAAKLANPELVKKNNVFPYQLLTAYQNTSNVPTQIRNALQDALEAATENVPSFGCETAVCVDVSGSMDCSITGSRGVSSVTTCVDVAGLIASCIVRKNNNANVIPFDTRVRKVEFNSRDSVMTNARKFAMRGGGTSCAVAMKYLNDSNWKGDLVIFVSDNESWSDFDSSGRYSQSTGLNYEWQKFKRNNPNAKLVLIDLQPYAHTQVKDNKDVLNIGGWSDEVFTVIDNFVKGKGDHFVDVINSVEL